MNFSFSKLLKNDWVITLSATLIGVFLAMYLNELVASKNIRNQKTIATKNIFSEIESNKQSLVKSIDTHTELLETLRFVSTYLDEDENLIVPADSMATLRAKYPALIAIEDSTLLYGNTYDYSGEINLNVSIPYLQLTNIAWQTLKSSGISTTFDFSCLMYLETIDKWTNEVLKKDEVLLQYITGSKDSGNKNEELLDHLELLLDYEKSLIKIYDRKERELKDCG
ncbi:MAG: hypothetical protein AAGA77_20245 [Bacteroidota bacterium]